MYRVMVSWQVNNIGFESFVVERVEDIPKRIADWAAWCVVNHHLQDKDIGKMLKIVDIQKIPAKVEYSSESVIAAAQSIFNNRCTLNLAGFTWEQTSPEKSTREQS